MTAQEGNPEFLGALSSFSEETMAQAHLKDAHQGPARSGTLAHPAWVPLTLLCTHVRLLFWAWSTFFPPDPSALARPHPKEPTADTISPGKLGKGQASPRTLWHPSSLAGPGHRLPTGLPDGRLAEATR